jgi:hypothetical protein
VKYPRAEGSFLIARLGAGQSTPDEETAKARRARKYGRLLSSYRSVGKKARYRAHGLASDRDEKI